MSICRWSSDNMQSDVYVIETISDAFTVYVADRHPINSDILGDTDEVLVQKYIIDQNDVDEYRRLSRLRGDRILNELEWRPVTEQHAGKIYHADTLQDLRQLLEHLSREGVHVPDVAFDNIHHRENEYAYYHG